MQDFHAFLEAKKAEKAPKTACCGGQKTPKGQGMTGGQQPQTADGKGISSKKQGGFAYEGDDDLIYDPSKKSKPGKSTVQTAEACAAVKTIRDAIVSNPRFVEYLVSELNRVGLTGCLIGELV